MRTPKVNFSNIYANGSNTVRLQKSQNMTLSIIKKVIEQYKAADAIPINQIEKLYKINMPETIYFQIKKLSDSEQQACGGRMATVYNKENLAINYKICLPAKNNLLQFKDINILVHETTHFFDGIMRPKYNKNGETVYNKKLGDFADVLYDNVFYDANLDSDFAQIGIKEAEKITKNYIKDLDTKEKLCVLNYIKLMLETEQNAYTTEKKCVTALKAAGYNNINDYSEFSIFNFDKKIEMLNKLIYKIILKERCSMAINNSSNIKDKIKIYLEYCLKSLM